MKKLLLRMAFAMPFSFVVAQVGINTQTPRTTLDVNGSIQLRNELRINNDPGTAGQVYFSQGSTGTINDWKNVSVSFLEDGQYQLVNTFAKRDQLGIDWSGTTLTTNVFTETFENNSSTRAGWTSQLITNGTTGPAWQYLAGSSANSGITTGQGGSALNARFGGSGVATNGQRRGLVSPVLNFSGFSANLRLNFWYAQPQNSNSTNLNNLRVYYRTSTDGNTWNTWTQISGTNYTANQTAWTQVTNLELPSSANVQYYQIAFEGHQRGTGYANVVDNVEIYSTATSNAYNNNLSTLNEAYNTTNRNWVRIPGLDLPVTINNDDNKLSFTFQTGVESRLDPANNTTAQTAGYIRYMCGLFRREASQSINSAVLVALRANQIDNFDQKNNQAKSQSIFTLNYVVEDVPAGDYVFSTACRRLVRSGGGSNSTDSNALLSIGNAVNSGTATTSDFMMNSVVKMDVIELVTYSSN